MRVGQNEAVGEDKKARIQALRGMLRQMERSASERTRTPVVETGLAALDGLLPHGGVPSGGVSEVTGPEGGGRLTVALLAAAAATRAGRLAAVVDAGGRLYPPAVAALGVRLGRLCVVRPPAGERAAWAAEQLARSGCFAVVVLDPLHRVTPVQAERLRRAATSGGTALIVVGRGEIGGWASLPSEVRLGVRPGGGGLAVTVLRARGAAPGATAVIAGRGGQRGEAGTVGGVAGTVGGAGTAGEAAGTADGVAGTVGEVAGRDGAGSGAVAAGERGRRWGAVEVAWAGASCA